MSKNTNTTTTTETKTLTETEKKAKRNLYARAYYAQHKEARKEAVKKCRAKRGKQAQCVSCFQNGHVKHTIARVGVVCNRNVELDL